MESYRISSSCQRGFVLFLRLPRNQISSLWTGSDPYLLACRQSQTGTLSSPTAAALSLYCLVVLELSMAGHSSRALLP